MTAIDTYQCKLICISWKSSLCRARAELLESGGQLTHQSTLVSIQIKKLEDSLQVKLFERLGRQIYLTREGAAVLGHVAQLTRISSNLENDLRDLKAIGRGASFSRMQQGSERKRFNYMSDKIINLSRRQILGYGRLENQRCAFLPVLD